MSFEIKYERLTTNPFTSTKLVQGNMYEVITLFKIQVCNTLVTLNQYVALYVTHFYK